MSWVNYDEKVAWHRHYRAGAHPEEKEQMLVVQYARAQRRADGIFHAANGGGRSKAEAGILKAMGVTPGVHDLFLPVMVRRANLYGADPWGGLWIEMKVVKVRNHPSKVGQMQVQATEVSPEQEAWARRMIEQGYAVVICWWAEAAQAAIDRYLTGRWEQRPVEELLKGYKL